MEPVNVMSTLKVQQYLNNQNLGDDVLNFVDTLKFNSLMTDEQFNDVKDKVERYRTLDAELQRNPSPEVSRACKNLAEDVLYATGQDIKNIKLGELQTVNKLDQAMINTNLRSKNDLFVRVDYDDYSHNSNYVKCTITSHDDPNAYGISPNARMIITKSGKIITMKNAIYSK